MDATDKEGCTPLIRLLDNKRSDAALFLIEQGADTEIADNSGHRAIDYATVRFPLIQAIISGVSPSSLGVFNMSFEAVSNARTVSDCPLKTAW